MEKVDMIIAVVGAVAILATVLGVVFYEEVQGNQDIHFPTMTQEVNGTMDGMSAGNHPFPVMLPDNATSLSSISVLITANGQQSPLASGGSYQVIVTGPNGTRCESTVENHPGAAGSTTVTIDDCAWASAPEETRAPSADEADMAMAWDEDVTVTVNIVSPSDQAANVPNFGYTYDIDFTADLHVYHAAVKPVDSSGNI